MNNKADWLSARELEEIAAMCRALDVVSEDVVSFGAIEIFDTNGETLGFIETGGVEGAHFVPNGWRKDD